MRKPEWGTFKLRPNGSFVYTPPPNFVGVVRFKFRILDNQGGQSAVIRNDPSRLGVR